MRSDSIGIFWSDIPVTKVKKTKVKKVPVERTWESPDFLPYFEEAIAFRINEYTDAHLIAEASKHPLDREKLVFDIESYWDYFCIGFKGVDSGRIFYIEKHVEDGLGILSTSEVAKIEWVLKNFTCVTFNGNWYDIPILTLALQYTPVDQLKHATNLLINGASTTSYQPVRPRELYKEFRVKALKKESYDHIDLIEVAPLDGSLKIYSGRLHAQRVQDLPYHPETILTYNQRLVVRWYCLNDLTNTVELFLDLKPQIELREQIGQKYGGIDLRSKSDAQIAESIISSELKKLTGKYPERLPEEYIYALVGERYRYEVPDYLQFKTNDLQWVLHIIRNSLFVVGPNGRIALPDSIKDLGIPIGQAVYSLGIGGLHSTEESISHYSDEEYVLKDRDVASYYPRIILNLGLYPEHLGRDFLTVYNSIVERRLHAKNTGDKLTAETLKITVNGSFGKTGNKYSLLYEPRLVMQTTITGQLCLLLLIEELELKGFQVISANTDGVVTKVKRSREDEFQSIIKNWERVTGFTTEETTYLSVHSRDVNNYIAVKEDQTKEAVKLKGAYGKADLKKNPQNEICNDAVIEYLLHKTPLIETIHKCRDMRKFVTVRKVKGGAAKQYASHIPEEILQLSKRDVCLKAGFEESGKDCFLIDKLKYDLEDSYGFAIKKFVIPGEIEYVGSTVRWYYSTKVEGEILIAKTGGKVPKSDGAKPMQDWPNQFPDDIDYNWYLEESQRILVDIGYAKAETKVLV